MYFLEYIIKITEDIIYRPVFKRKKVLPRTTFNSNNNCEKQMWNDVFFQPLDSILAIIIIEKVNE